MKIIHPYFLVRKRFLYYRPSAQYFGETVFQNASPKHLLKNVSYVKIHPVTYNNLLVDSANAAMTVPMVIMIFLPYDNRRTAYGLSRKY